MIDAYQDGFPVTPLDATQLSFSGLWVGGAGNVVITTDKGTVLTFLAVPAGTWLRIRGTRVMTATTATNIVGLI